jgi:anhydro-N-acetylmuramic acid kinase
MLIDFLILNKNNRILPSMKEMNRNKMEILGLMSGTSLDGLDIAHVSFEFQGDKIHYELQHAHTYRLDDTLLIQLHHATKMSAEQLFILDKQLGRFFADCVQLFINEKGLEKSQIDAIASHGQTIFHQPQNGFTHQIGCGSTIAFLTGIPVINDFRNLDVITGGQGAPLVPLGDFELFANEAESFLNLGGFANISFKKNNVIQAFDIAPANLPSNILMQQIGELFDRDGEKAKSGELNQSLLDSLNSLPFYASNGPKSLGTEWLNREYMPLFNQTDSLENLLRTHTEHVAFQVAHILNDESINSVYITGGGAKNAFFIERLSHHYKGKCLIPSNQIIDFKEAIVFAFLGARYLRGETTNVPSVTGASKALCTGVFHRGG